MKTSELSKKHPGIKELAKRPFGRVKIRNYGEGASDIELRWNPTLAKNGIFELTHEGKTIRIDAEELRYFTRVF